MDVAISANIFWCLYFRDLVAIIMAVLITYQVMKSSVAMEVAVPMEIPYIQRTESTK